MNNLEYFGNVAYQKHVMNKRSQKQNIELGAGSDPQFKPAGNSAQKTEQATKPDRTISIPLKHGGGFSAAAQLDNVSQKNGLRN